jgi:hypothetical protein
MAQIQGVGDGYWIYIYVFFKKVKGMGIQEISMIFWWWILTILQAQKLKRIILSQIPCLYMRKLTKLPMMNFLFKKRKFSHICTQFSSSFLQFGQLITQTRISILIRRGCWRSLCRCEEKMSRTMKLLDLVDWFCFEKFILSELTVVKCVGNFVRISEDQWCWKVFWVRSPNFIWRLKGQTQGGEGSVIAGLQWPWYLEMHIIINVQQNRVV